MTNVRPVNRPRESAYQGGNLTHLRSELAMSRLRLEVALAVVTMIHDAVPGRNDQIAVIDDVIARWRGRGRVERAAYQQCDSPFSPLTRFAWDTVDAIDAEPFAGLDDASRPSEDEADAIHLRHWRRHVARLRGTPTGQSSDRTDRADSQTRANESA